MNVLFYMARPGGNGEELLRSLSPIVSAGGLEAVSDWGSFSEYIRRPMAPASVAIIWNPSNEDLRKIGSVRDLLKGGRTLLVLADQDKETIALAHSLLPAFITYVDDGNSKVLSVMRKLARSAVGGPAPAAFS